MWFYHFRIHKQQEEQGRSPRKLEILHTHGLLLPWGTLHPVPLGLSTHSSTVLTLALRFHLTALMPEPLLLTAPIYLALLAITLRRNLLRLCFSGISLRVTHLPGCSWRTW